MDEKNFKNPKQRKRQPPDFEYINRFAAENYDRITILVPKGGKDRIKHIAQANSQSVSEYIVGLIPKALVGTFKREEKEE